MPNHVHGIVWLPRRRPPTRWPIDVGAQRPPIQEVVSVPECDLESERHHISVDAAPLQHHDHISTAGLPLPRSVGSLVRSFKSTATKAVNRARAVLGLPVWQRGYHERIIRNEGELARVRQYILNNPGRWSEDPNNAEAA